MLVMLPWPEAPCFFPVPEERILASQDPAPQYWHHGKRQQRGRLSRQGHGPTALQRDRSPWPRRASDISKDVFILMAFGDEGWVLL